MTRSLNTGTDTPRTSAAAEPVARRWVVWGLLASGSTAAIASALTAWGRYGPHRQTGFAETYRGRRIAGTRYDTGSSADGAHGTWQVTVDGRPLHLMRRADGSWMTMVDHYQSYPSPLAAARAAVDELGPTARLAAPGGRDSRMDDGTVRTPVAGRMASGNPKDHLHGVHAQGRQHPHPLREAPVRQRAARDQTQR